jgi:4,5-DOPA dioxygenase extradiol
MEPLPVAFVSHGSPLLALESSAWHRSLAGWGRQLRGLKAVIVVSAHWESSDAFLVTTSPEPGILHDFSGFPEALYRLDYRVPGDVPLATRVIDLLQSAGLGASGAERPLDHGAWVPLRAMLPEASHPVLQVSLPRPRDPDLLAKAGRALAPLRKEGVLLLGSGGLVHNLRRLVWEGQPEPEPWAAAFEDWVMASLEGDPGRLARADREAPGHAQAVPTPEHFDPIHFSLGAATGDSPLSIHSGWQHGNLSLRALSWG